MGLSLIRATFGRMSKESLGRITIGHIVGTVPEVLLRRRTGGKAGKNVQKDPDYGVKFIPISEEFKKQRLREDRELIDIILAMAEGKLI